MKQFRFAHILFSGLLAPLGFSTCTSEDAPYDQNWSGFGPLNNTYVFYIDDDYGQMIVEVKDSKGALKQSDNDLISQYYPIATNPTPDCSSSGKQNNAVFQLAPGSKYTFTAYNSNHSFTGTIDLSCNGGECIYINISPK